MSTSHEDLEGEVSYWSAPNTIVQGVLSFGVDASNNHFLEVCGMPCIRVLSPTQAKQIITQAKQLKERATLPQRTHNAARTGRRTVAFGFASNDGLACAGQGISRRQAPCKPNTVDRTGPSAAAAAPAAATLVTMSGAFDAPDPLADAVKAVQAALWPNSSQCFRWHAAPQYDASLQRAHFFAPLAQHTMQICGGSAPRDSSSDATAK